MATVAGVQRSLGVTDPGDEAGAWAALKKLVGEAVREASSPAVRAGTVTHLVPAFLDAKRSDVTARTLRGYGQYLAWLAKHFGGEAVASLDLKRVRGAAQAEPSWGDTHRFNVLWCANSFLRWCGRGDRIALPVRESRGGDAVIPEEVHRRVVNETTGDFRQLVRFLWLTGCRPGEATGLTCESVDWAAGTVKLRKHKTRHKGKVRVLYLCKEAVEILADQKAKHETGHLFRGLRGKPLSLQAMTMRFERLSEKVGRRVCSYDYRHTFASRALSAGVPDTQVAAMLGHSSTTMVHRHYSHIGENARLLKEVAEKIARAG